jgi:hypothetical protein
MLVFPDLPGDQARPTRGEKRFLDGTRVLGTPGSPG